MSARRYENTLARDERYWRRMEDRIRWRPVLPESEDAGYWAMLDQLCQVEEEQADEEERQAQDIARAIRDEDRSTAVLTNVVRKAIRESPGRAWGAGGPRSVPRTRRATPPPKAAHTSTQRLLHSPSYIPPGQEPDEPGF